MAVNDQKHFTCDVCSTQFTTKYNMQRHEAKFHGKEKTVKADVRCPGSVNYNTTYTVCAKRPPAPPTAWAWPSGGARIYILGG